MVFSGSFIGNFCVGCQLKVIDFVCEHKTIPKWGSHDYGLCGGQLHGTFPLTCEKTLNLASFKHCTSFFMAVIYLKQFCSPVQKSW